MLGFRCFFWLFFFFQDELEFLFFLFFLIFLLFLVDLAFYDWENVSQEQVKMLLHNEVIDCVSKYTIFLLHFFFNISHFFLCKFLI